MPNYVDNFDIVDANQQTTNVLLQDRGTLALANQIALNVGDLSTLDTTDKTNLVNAINETLTTLSGYIGDLSTLDTSDNSSVVNAINEVLTKLENYVGTLANLNTTDKSHLVNAINEVLADVGSLSSLQTSDSTSVVNAINEVLNKLETDVGSMASLTTNDKSHLVNAINEVNTIRNRKVVIIGDSYAMRNTPNYLSILKGNLPNVYDGIGVSSIGFTPVSPYTFQETFDTFISSYSTAQKNAVTDVVLAGGWNDAREVASGTQTLSTLKTAIASTCAHIRSVCPNAVIHPCFMAWHSKRASQNQVTLNSLLVTMNAYDTVYSPYTVSLCDVKYIMRWNFNMDNSYFHPNDTTGAEGLANALHENLFSGSFNYSVSANFVPAYFSTNNAFDSSTIIRVAMDKDITRIASAPVALNGASITGGIIAVFSADYMPIALPGGVSQLGGGEFVILNCYVKGTINGTAYAHYVPAMIYLYASSGNLLMVAPDGTLVTSLSSVYMILDSTINNELCV